MTTQKRFCLATAGLLLTALLGFVPASTIAQPVPEGYPYAYPFGIPSSGTVGYVYGDETSYGTHAGIDINNSSKAPGTVPVYAVYDGTVAAIYDDDFIHVSAGDSSAVMVCLRHENVTDASGNLWPDVYTWYMHMANSDGKASYIKPTLYEGAPVNRGELLGYQGNKAILGDAVTHLHFQVQKTSNNAFFKEAIDYTPFIGPQKKGTQITADSELTGPGFVDAILIVDESSSMQTNDPGLKRLAASRAYVSASLGDDRVGVLAFATVPRLVSRLLKVGDSREALNAAIDEVGSSGSSTNIRDAISAACAELDNGASEHRGAILLTDGQHNKGTFGNPQQCFVDKGWPIYAFGFGSANMTLLSQIASETGGEATAIADVSSLLCEFAAVRAKMAGSTPEPCETHLIQPHTSTELEVQIPPGQATSTFTTSWVGSDIQTTLQSPSGRQIDRETVADDVRHDLGANYEMYTVTNPEPGTWLVSLYGLDVPIGGEEAVFGMSSVPAPIREIYVPLISR